MTGWRRVVAVTLVLGTAVGLGTAPFTMTAGASTVATHFSVTTSVGTAVSGAPIAVTVTALDSAGNTATTYSGTAQFTSSDTAVGISLPTDYTFTTGSGLDNGVHTFAGVILETTGGQAITAADSLSPSIAGTSSQVTVTPARLLVALPATTTAGTAVDMTVTAQDANGTTSAAYLGTAHFTTTDPANLVPPDFTFMAGDAGTHTFAGGVDFHTAGDQTVTAVDTTQAVLTGTSAPPTAVSAGAAHDFAVVGPSHAAAGTDQSVSVTAQDAYGNTSTLYTGTVTFTSTDTAAVLPGPYTFVGGDSGSRLFTVNFHSSGNQTVTATDATPPVMTGTSAPTTAVSPLEAVTLAVSGPATATAATPITVTVTATDTYGNTDPTYTGTIRFTSSDGSAGLPADYTFTPADNGTHAFSSVVLRTAGSQTVTAADTVTASITGATGAIAVGAASATHLVVTSDAASTAGNTTSVTVTAEDASGNVDTGYAGTIHFTSSAAGTALPADYTFVNGDNGAHTFTVTYDDAGTQTVTATDVQHSTVSGTSDGTVVSPAAASRLLLATPSTASAGTYFLATVTAMDPYGNPVPSYAGAITFTSTDGLATLPHNATLSGGVGTFAITLHTPGSQTVSVADPTSALSTGVSGSILVSPAQATHFSVSVPVSTTAGSQFSVTVTALDATDAVVTSYLGKVQVTSSDGQATLPAAYSFAPGDNGSHSFAVTLRTSGPQTVTATDTATSSITGSGPTAVGAAAATTLSASAPAAATSGVPFQVVVTALDAYNNVATGYPGTVRFTSTDAHAVVAADSTLIQGTGSFTTTLNTVGGWTVTAADTLTPSITGTTASIAVTAAAATHFTVAAPLTAVAGAPVTVTVTARDAAGNVATSYTGTAHFTSTDPGVTTLPPNYTFLVADRGVHSFASAVTLVTAGGRTVTAADIATASIAGTSNPIVVSASPAISLTVTGLTNAAAGTVQTATVTAKDRYGNTATGYTGTIAFTSTDPAAVKPAGYTFLVADSGIHAFSGVSFHTAATTPTLTATDTVTASITGTSLPVTITAAPAASLIVAATSPQVAGIAFTVTVTARDLYGNTATGYTGTAHFTSTDTGGITVPADYTFTTGSGLDNGVHVFTSGVTLVTAGSRTVKATDTVTASITGTSSPIVVSASTAAALTIVTTSPQVGGTPFTVTVTARDSHMNAATTYSGTVHFTSTDPGATTLPANYTFGAGDNGVHVFTNGVTLVTAGTPTVTATDTLVPSITGTSAPITVTSLGVTFSFSGGPSSSTTGTAFSETLTAKLNGATASTYVGTVHFSSTDGSATLPADYTFRHGSGMDNGVHTFAGGFTLRSIGGQTMTATDTSSPLITGTSASVTVAAPAFHPQSVGAPSVAVSGSTQVVFWQGAGGHLFEAWYDAQGWHGPVDWTSTAFAGNALMTSAPSVAVLGSTQLVFWRGAGGHLFEAWHSSGWNGPVDVTASSFGGAAPLASTPSVAVTGSTQVVFWEGGGGHLFEAWYAGGWNGPVDWTASAFHGTGLLASSPSAAMVGSTQVVFWQGAGGHLFEAWYAGGWNGPVDVTAASLGGAGLLSSAPSVAVSGTTQVVFWRGAHGHLFEAWFAGGWHGPVDWTASAFGGRSPLISAPTVAYNANGVQLVFWQSAGQHLVEAWYQGGWNGPVDYSA